ncbi:hypothetical protein [Streptomyces sudanensis]|uniref:hypothetical protein n=1 Tax=Streptomyces sudanensis TaxID=436397 RepID=UPI0020CF42B9|nr:hypothetical protein [Streptomyces sudanensis]MCP9958977.1 hypothetical protein [Streptomyces sudanensis]MCP9988047.1 hypothetical protein [Streptomyces sudanensis]MCQ0000548.1 hypothetical protein [Streptomyces sudanensis]
MRPARFAEFVIDAAKNQPATTRVQTLAEAGDTQYPYGVALTRSDGREVRWQFTGQLPEGAKHDGFTDEPVTGTPPAAGPAPQDGDTPEAWLAAVLAHAECPEIASIERWSTRPDPGSQQGLTLTFHNGARIFARVL